MAWECVVWLYHQCTLERTRRSPWLNFHCDSLGPLIYTGEGRLAELGTFIHYFCGPPYSWYGNGHPAMHLPTLPR